MPKLTKKKALELLSTACGKKALVVHEVTIDGDCCTILIDMEINPHVKQQFNYLLKQQGYECNVVFESTQSSAGLRGGLMIS